jgi:phosphatidylserine/phosphatidylglycerophosphate/cardiolipin synthase-like enzyme
MTEILADQLDRTPEEMYIVSPWISFKAARLISRLGRKAFVITFPPSRYAALAPPHSLLGSTTNLWVGSVHAKFMIFQRQSWRLGVFGSENLTDGDNLELVIITTDPGITSGLKRKFHDFLGACHRWNKTG